MNRFIFTLLLTSFGLSSFASIKVGYLCYNLDSSKKTASVTFEAMGDHVNYQNNPTDIIIPSEINFGGLTYTVVEIGPRAFQDCETLYSIQIPSSVKVIEFCAFYNCMNLKSIDIPNSVTGIGQSAFCMCTNLESAIVGNSITDIGSNTFFNCSRLKTLTLGSSVEYISSAFGSCQSLTTIYCYAVVPPACYSAFTGASYPLCTVHVPIESWSLYKKAKEWKDFYYISADLSDGIDDICADFYDDKVVVYSLTGIKLPISSRDELDSLPTGIYIVNGKKTLLP